MAVNKTPKIATLTAFGLTGWLLPLAYPASVPVTSFSLALSAFSSGALALELQRESLVSSVANTERKLTLEALAFEQSLRHQAELDRLRELYGFGDEDEDDRYQPQPALNGTTIHQGAIGGAPTPDGNLWNLDQLLSSNSSHVLLIGQTGSGKTTLARWLIGQLNSGKTIVLDADDDGQTWQGFQVVGCGDNWTDIDTAMSQGLEDFHNRKPNGNNTQTVYVLEELPDLISECKGGVEFCNRILRRGRKRKMFVIGLTQDPNTGTIGLSQPTQKCFTRIYLGGMARYALTNLVPRNQRQALSSALSSCTRGSIVEFLGEWFAWDVPNLGISTTPPAPTRQAVQVAEGNPIAILDRSLATSPKPEGHHYQILDMCLGSRDGFVSVRDVQRALSIPTSEQVKAIFYELVSLELGEIEADKLPNGHDRVLFRAYPPMP